MAPLYGLVVSFIIFITSKSKQLKLGLMQEFAGDSCFDVGGLGLGIGLGL